MDVDFGPAQRAVQPIIENVRIAVEQQTGHVNIYLAVLFRTQMLDGGTNWLIKVKIGEGNQDYLHLLINQAQPIEDGPFQLVGQQPGHTANDPIVPFDVSIN